MLEVTGPWYGGAKAAPNVYHCGSCEATGVVRVNFKAMRCPHCKGRGSATAAELGLAPEPEMKAAA